MHVETFLDAKNFLIVMPCSKMSEFWLLEEEALLLKNDTSRLIKVIYCTIILSTTQELLSITIKAVTTICDTVCRNIKYSQKMLIKQPHSKHK